ncbi:uncharacterized protein LOC117808893 [Notolabrus celidotus]|uniref:uncharacterized protein LOC117808893 n=1 Tax=Notolabrus celidotus TaxID=1203425 RepID=UPI00148FCC68|nr:uncharacterized protein LOC117808893 [Notolabrus celidotus]
MDEFNQIRVSLILVALLHVTVTENNQDDSVSLKCALFSADVSRYKVKWLYGGEDVDGPNQYVPKEESVTFFMNSYTLNYSSINSFNTDLFSCEVTHSYTGRVQYFNVQSSGSREPVFYTSENGDDVTLSCGNVTKDQHHCENTTWTYSGSGYRAVELVRLGQVGENTGAKSGRLRVTEDCSLVVTNVTEEDVGRYVCRQNTPGGRTVDTVYLSLITMTEQESGEDVTLICSVSMYGICSSRVKWLFEGKVMNEHHPRGRSSQRPCSASMTLQTRDSIYKLRHDSLQCEVTSNERQLFPFRLQASGEKSGTASTEPKVPTETSMRAEKTSWPLYYTVKLEDMVTLPCENVINSQQKCNSTSWVYYHTNSEPKELVKHGQIIDDTHARMNVTEDCSLVLPAWTGDEGRYVCKQDISGQRQANTEIDLSILLVSENNQDDSVGLSCALLSADVSRYKVKCLYGGEDVDGPNQYVPTEERDTFFSKGYTLNYSSINSFNTDLLSCEVTHSYTGRVQYFNVQSSGSREPVFYTSENGDDVTLSCGNVTKDQLHCENTTWTYSGSGYRAVELVRLGQVGENTGAKSGRLRVTEDCSLVVKNVTEEDVGRYVCRQNTPGGRTVDTVYLSLITMTEQESGEDVTLICSVSMYGICSSRVKWLFEGKVMNEHHPRGRSSQRPCSASMTLQTRDSIYKLRHDSLQCEVTSNERQLFPFRLQASGEKSGTASTEPKEPTETSMRAARLRFIVVSLGLSALIITVVTVNIWARTKGRRGKQKEHLVRFKTQIDILQFVGGG